MTVSKKKLLKWEKTQKNIHFHSNLILSTFLWKGKIFDSTRAELSPLCSICFWWLEHFLISLSRGLDIFTMLNYFPHLTSFKQIESSIEDINHHFYHVANTIKVIFLFFLLSIKDPICLKLAICFCCYSASTKTSFGFCSCSELPHLKFGKKMFAGKCKLLSPQGKISSNLYRASVRDMNFFFCNASFGENYSMVLKIYANPNTLVCGVTSQVCISSNNNTSNSGGVTHWRWSWIM